MINRSFFLLAACSVFILPMSSAFAVGGLDDNKVVGTKEGRVVYSMLSGECVRTKWEAGKDPCAPEPRKLVQAPPPRPVERTVLSSEEKTVYFNFDSAKLTPEAQQQLDGVARKLSTARDIRSADIVGFADRIGSANYNQRLSQKRAETVKDYLAQRGYLNTRVAEVRGLGESKSVTNCDTTMPRANQIACLSADRRVEVEVQYLDAQRLSRAQ